MATKRVTGESLYQEHVRQIVEEHGAQLPPWERIPQWERDLWEEQARETKGPNHDG